MIDLSRDGDLFVATLKNGENRIDLDFALRMNDVLDRVLSESDGACALVATGEGKFFSNGLALEWLMSAPPADRERFGAEFERLNGRLVAAPIPTVAALNGHAFAAGALFAMAFDFRMMREDRGWICMPEVDVGVPVSPGAMALLRAKLPPKSLRDALLTGRRYAADDAIEAGFADEKASESQLLDAAKRLAASLGSKERKIFASLKATLYGELAGPLRNG